MTLMNCESYVDLYYCAISEMRGFFVGPVLSWGVLVEFFSSLSSCVRRCT